MSKKTIGILGGMGPLATAELFTTIIKETNAATDQDHFPVLVDNNTAIADRSASLMGKGPSPVPEMKASARRLELTGADCLIMPCNTAHAFYDEVASTVSIPFLHMPRETARTIAEHYPQEARIGVLATKGTYLAGVYKEALGMYGLKQVMPDGEGVAAVMDLIYKGIKTGDLGYDDAAYRRVIAALRGQGVNVFILGCTELSVAHNLHQYDGVFVDPLRVIAGAAIRECGFADKEPASPLLRLLKKTRSYRRFDESKSISAETLRTLLEVTRYCPSGHNHQPLRFVLVTEKTDRLFLQQNMGWAGGLTDWDGPAEGERPTAYIVIAQDRTARKADTVDHALVAHAILMRATELGLGGCMFASLRKDPIHAHFRLADTLGRQTGGGCGRPQRNRGPGGRRQGRKTHVLARRPRGASCPQNRRRGRHYSLVRQKRRRARLTVHAPVTDLAHGPPRLRRMGSPCSSLPLCRLFAPAALDNALRLL